MLPAYRTRLKFRPAVWFLYLFFGLCFILFIFFFFAPLIKIGFRWRFVSMVLDCRSGSVLLATVSYALFLLIVFTSLGLALFNPAMCCFLSIKAIIVSI